MGEKILKIKHLCITFPSVHGEIYAVRDVSFELDKGIVTAVVGESGCGKSVMMRALMGLTELTGGCVGEKSEILFGKDNILKWGSREWNSYRGRICSMIFQDAMASLNPTISIGKQLMEPLMIHGLSDKERSREYAIKILNEVNISNPGRCMKQYPHELSGGMRQRIMIAISLITHPQIVIADEPTTSLDVTTQVDILKLLQYFQNQMGMSVILVSHDLSLVSTVAERIMVMYGGHIVEDGYVKNIMLNPKHPYTKALLEAIPNKEEGERKRLRVIAGSPPNLALKECGCPFAMRCPECMNICQKEMPPMFEVGESHSTACWLYYK